MRPTRPTSFPKRPPAPMVPFGRRPPSPNVFAPVSPGLRGGVGILRLPFRLVPWIGWALLAYDLWELWRWWQDAHIFPPPDGYVFCSPDVGNRDIAYRYVSTPSCTTYQPLGAQPPVWHPTTRWYTRCERHRAKPSTFDRWNYREHWYYEKDPGQVPEFIPAQGWPFEPVPLEVPFVPWFDPFLNPPLAPAPAPLPKPIRHPPLPELPYPEKGEAGYGPRPDLRPDASPNGRPWPSRPPQGTKERKIKTGSSSATAWLLWLLGQISEVGDLVDALFDALPDAVKSKYPDNTAGHLRGLYENLDKVDVTEAVHNLWTNNVEDHYLGQFFGEAAEQMGLGDPLKMPPGVL